MANNYLLEFNDITKLFPGVVALNKVNFNLKKGEVHALLGENGAGKSTLIKVLSGALKPEYGEIIIEGQETIIQSPRHAQDLGIATIYQEFNLISELTIAQNIFLGHEPKKNGGLLIDWKELYKKASELLDFIGIDINPRLLVSDISVSQQQMVEIAKALSMNAKIIIFDEPTGTLTSKDIDNLFTIIKKLKEREIGIIYISHRLEEIYQIADRATVLRDGLYIDTFDVEDVNKDQLIYSMIDQEIENIFSRNYNKFGEEMLRVEDLSSQNFSEISFSVHQGEILGFYGLVGSGRTEIMRAIFGIDDFDKGKIFIKEKEFIPNTLKSLEAGLAFIPENRMKEGLCLNLSVKENAMHVCMGDIFPSKIINKEKELNLVNKSIEDLQIKTPNIDQQVQHLSGGNKQKVVLAKWLLTEAKIFIFDEPTRGIDVGAKSEFHKLIDYLVAEGAAVIMISSEIPEVLGMSDNLCIMRDGKIVKKISKDSATQEKILKHAIK